MFNDTTSGKTVLIVAVALAVLTAFTGGAAALATLDVRRRTMVPAIQQPTISTRLSIVPRSRRRSP